MVTSDFRPEVEIWPFLACVMHPTIIIRTLRSLWTWLWDRYHVLQNAFLVLNRAVTVSDEVGGRLYGISVHSSLIRSHSRSLAASRDPG